MSFILPKIVQWKLFSGYLGGTIVWPFLLQNREHKPISLFCWSRGLPNDCLSIQTLEASCHKLKTIYKTNAQTHVILVTVYYHKKRDKKKSLDLIPSLRFFSELLSTNLFTFFLLWFSRVATEWEKCWQNSFPVVRNEETYFGVRLLWMQFLLHK